MPKLQSACIFLPHLPSTASLADTEFFRFNSYRNNRDAVYSDIAEKLPDFTVPAGFSAISSIF